MICACKIDDLSANNQCFFKKIIFFLSQDNGHQNDGQYFSTHILFLTEQLCNKTGTYFFK